MAVKFFFYGEMKVKKFSSKKANTQLVQGNLFIEFFCSEL